MQQYMIAALCSVFFAALSIAANKNGQQQLFFKLSADSQKLMMRPTEPVHFQLKTNDPIILENLDGYRYLFVLMFESGYGYHILDQVTVSPVADDDVQVQGDQYQGHFVMPDFEDEMLLKANKARICLKDTRPTFSGKIVGSDIHCSNPLRVAPSDAIYVPNEEVVETYQWPAAKYVDSKWKKSIFPVVPRFIRSFMFFNLEFNITAVLPYAAQHVEIYLKGNAKHANLKVPQQNVRPAINDESMRAFNVKFVVPKLDAESSSYKVCVRIKFRSSVSPRRERGCSSWISVAEMGSSGSKMLKNYGNGLTLGTQSAIEVDSDDEAVVAEEEQQPLIEYSEPASSSSDVMKEVRFEESPYISMAVPEYVRKAPSAARNLHIKPLQEVIPDPFSELGRRQSEAELFAKALKASRAARTPEQSAEAFGRQPPSSDDEDDDEYYMDLRHVDLTKQPGLRRGRPVE